MSLPATVSIWATSATAAISEFSELNAVVDENDEMEVEDVLADPNTLRCLNLSMRQLLQSFFRLPTFYLFQWKAIRAAISGQNVAILSQCGSGKSLCFQIPALYQNGVQRGVTVVIEPTVAIIIDQVNNLLENKVSAMAWIGDMPQINKSLLLRQLEDEKPPALLYVTPEALDFLKGPLQVLRRRNLVARFVLDEAHLAVKWGEAFRPKYLDLQTISAEFPGVPWTFLSASMLPEDMLSFSMGLRQPVRLVLGKVTRENIFYEVMVVRSDFSKAAIDYIKARPNVCGIVFCSQQHRTHELVKDFAKSGISSLAFHGRSSDRYKSDLQKNYDMWLAGECQILVSTTAASHGVDRRDVRFTIHIDTPESMEMLLQGTGRAGRDGKPADCLIFHHLTSTTKWLTIKRTELDDASDSADIQRMKREKADLYKVVKFTADKTVCRRVGLLAPYTFTTKPLPPNCGNCDVCCTEHNLVRVDVTVPFFQLGKIFQDMERMSPKRATPNKLIEVALGRLSIDLKNQVEGVADWQRIHMYGYFYQLGKGGSGVIHDLVEQLFVEEILDLEVVSFEDPLRKKRYRCYIQEGPRAAEFLNRRLSACKSPFIMALSREAAENLGVNIFDEPQ